MNEKFDRRRKYYVVLDCETATLPYASNLPENLKKQVAIAKPLIYDLGWTIVDKKGNVYARENYLITEIFSVPEIFNTAYYAEKRPLYIDKLNKGEIVLTDCELPLLAKCLIVASANFVGVWIVKYFEEKARKDKLWKVEATVPFEDWETLDYNLTNHFIQHNYILLGEKYAVFNIYCPTQNDSKFAKKILDEHNAKYFVSESKTL